MDPIAHTFTGAALAASGLRRATPLASAALILGANAPDIDVLAFAASNFHALAFRRGWTHGLPAMLVLPFLLTALLLAWDRWIRRAPGEATARAGPLLALCTLAVATHPTLDWLNSYGMRWLMPFDGRWFYGDALFIIDPWLWLLLGGAACLAYGRHPGPRIAWSVFWLLASALILTYPMVPTGARVLWLLGVATILAASVAGLSGSSERIARIALGVAAAYIVGALLANQAARTLAAPTLEARGIAPVEQLMIGPMPADPFAGQLIAATPTAYHFGHWHWLRSPRLELSSDVIPRLPPSPALQAAASTPEARLYLTWSRFPYYEVESLADGRLLVRLRDARYRDRGRLEGPTVYLDPDPATAH